MTPKSANPFYYFEVLNLSSGIRPSRFFLLLIIREKLDNSKPQSFDW